MPPVTQQEALDFHERGQCVMSAPGEGLTGSRGWIGAFAPGEMELRGATFSDGKSTRDVTPGRVYLITADVAGQPVQWCLQFVTPGREKCGDVPKAFLYDLKKTYQ